MIERDPGRVILRVLIPGGNPAFKERKPSMGAEIPVQLLTKGQFINKITPFFSETIDKPGICAYVCLNKIIV
jgi:hypothetical protein